MTTTGVGAGTGLPPLLVHLVQDALEHWDFPAVRRALRASGLPRSQVQPLHRLAHAGQLLLDLDLEDLDRPPAVAQPLREDLRSVCLPQQPAPQPSGLLASLRPAAALLLDVVAVRHAQSDVDALLSAVHLLGEALPLLAWEPVLGHGGDPVQLHALVSGPGSLWATSSCPATGPGAHAARTLRRAGRDDGAWQEYLERAWSKLGDQLTTCGGCTAPCSLVALQDPGLRARLVLARDFARSPLMGARHGSTVGHAFAVPGRDEVDRAWRTTRERLRLDGRVDGDEHPLPGLRGLVEQVAGAPLPDDRLLERVRRAALTALGSEEP